MENFKLVLRYAWQLAYCEVISTEPVSKITDKPPAVGHLNVANYYETIEITVLQVFLSQTFELPPL